MSNGVFSLAIAGDKVLLIEDGRGRLRRTHRSRYLYVRQLLIGVGSDVGAEERERPFGLREIVEPGIPISRKDPGLYRRTLVVIHVLDRVSSDGDDHEPGSDGNGLLPVRSATIGGKVRLFEFQAVGDDLIVIGSRDHELAGRFVIRVVEGGKPVMRLLGQLSAENVLSPCLLLAMTSPSAETPR